MVMNLFPFLISSRSSYKGVTKKRFSLLLKKALKVLVKEKGHQRFITTIKQLLAGFPLSEAFFHTQRRYQEKIDTLEINLRQNHNIIAFLQKQLFTLQQEDHSCKLSSKNLKKLQEKTSLHQKKQAKSIVLSLDLLGEALVDSRADLSLQEQIDILYISYRKADALAKGFWHLSTKETVDLRDILDKLSALFAEKIYRSHIIFETTFPLTDVYSFKGDPLLTELLLINAVGKPIYRSPSHEKVSVTVSHKAEFLYLEIQDNGYIGTAITENLLRKAFHFFMEDTALQDLCQEQNIQYWHTTKEGKNTAHIMIPTQPSKDLPNNF